MSLIQQTIQLLSETPGNLVYHLVTLFALQAVFALSFSHWRRERSDQLAACMAWAAGAIFLARLGLLLVGMLLQDEPLTAVAALAPLEQTVHTTTAVFITWAIVSHSTRYPRLGNVLLFLALVIIGVMALSFTQTWQDQAAAGEAYNGSRQATIWGIVQLVVLGLGFVYSLNQSQWRPSLGGMTLGILLLAHVAHFWNYPELITTDTNIAYSIRLGHLIAFPLWAALAYRHTLQPLLLAQQARQSVGAQVARSLDLAADVIRSLEPEAIVFPAIAMAARITDAPFVGLALLDEQEERQLLLISNQPQATQDKPRSWYLNLADWPAFRQVLDQGQPVTLAPEGMGARQLHDWYQEMGIAPLGLLLIQPLKIHNDPVGLLLLAGPPEREAWPEDERLLVKSLADYLAQGIDNGRYQARAIQQATTAVIASGADTAVSGRIVALEEERSQLRSTLDTTTSRLQQAETRALEANKKARDLAATLNEIERISQNEQVQALEVEIEALRESLAEAEEAMALAAAGEGELSTEWVMHTITRYSGQLESAQERIEVLEEELARREQGPVSDMLASLVQELRTPMTSMIGYTEILLAERVGILGARQRDYVQRIQANTTRMGVLMEQIVQLATGAELPISPLEGRLVNVEEVVEMAVGAVITQIREKNLRLELDIQPDLPLTPIKENDLRQIMTSLLGNACQSSRHDGRVAVNVRTTSIPDPNLANDDEQGGHFQFVHLAVTDSGGGIQADDQARVFASQHQAGSPLIAGLGDTGAALPMARALTEANGGRVWVESVMGVGSTFSALFPLSLTEPAANGDAIGVEPGADVGL